MIKDLRTIFWKEWREHLREPSQPMPAWLTTLCVMALGGTYFGLTDPRSMAAWGPLVAGITGGIITLLVVADSFAGERERGTLEALLSTPATQEGILVGKILWVTVNGCASALVVFVSVGMTLALTTTAFGSMWQPMSLLSTAVFATLITLFLATLGTLVSLLSARVAEAQQRLFLLIFVLFFGVPLLFVGPLWLSDHLGVALPGWLAESVARTLRTARRMTLTSWIAFGSAVLAIGEVLVLGLALKFFDRGRIVALIR